MQLVFEWDGGARSYMVKAGEIKVGGAPDADLRVNLPGLSRHHAVVEINDEHDVAVRSAPGSSVVSINGETINGRTRVTADDKVTLGPVKMTMAPWTLPQAPGGAVTTAPGPPPQGFPATSAPIDSGPGILRPRRTRLITIVLAVIAAVIALGMLAAFGPLGFTAAFVAAVLPAPLLVWYLRRIDHFAPQPSRLLWVTFLWGATVAVIITFAVSLPIMVAAEVTTGGLDELGDMFLGAVVLAPIVEELAKAGAVVWVLWRHRYIFNGVMDGIVYGAMAGMGFAVTEDILYYAAALLEGGPAEFTALVFVRGIFSGFSHPLYSAAAGMGIALAVEVHRHRWFPPVAGLTAAMALHWFWNYSAYRSAANDSLFLFGAYVVVFVPVFFSFLFVVRWAMRREGRIVVKHLQPEVESGRLTTQEAQALGDMRRRKNAVAYAERVGPAAARHMRELQRAASELAFLRYRVAAARRDPTPEEREQERILIAQLQRQRASVQRQRSPA